MDNQALYMILCATVTIVMLIKGADNIIFYLLAWGVMGLGYSAMFLDKA
jgi:hypothetical protein